MPSSNPSQVRKGGRPVVSEHPDKAGVLDAFPEDLHYGVVRAALDLHDGSVDALKILLQRF
ncbi:hypothetical protein TIFTF001_030856 [Ficus carica]|uniref:Uncharacterized protein n=1 Tax=Ficus carica TaxID=3494 RepID=A0AA88DUA7_FICCA|nr:hypothetical protein TIFTF001_030856 [Ficus carica]